MGELSTTVRLDEAERELARVNIRLSVALSDIAGLRHRLQEMEAREAEREARILHLPKKQSHG